MSTPLLFWDVDTQVDFIHPDGKLYVPGAEETLGNLERLTEVAERLSIPILADADDHQLSDAEIDLEPDFETSFPPHCMRGTEGAERVDATRVDWTLEIGHRPMSALELRRGIDREWPRVLILKRTLDVFSNVNTEPLLERLDPERIVLYGVALDFCVRCVVEGLLERGHDDLILLTDASRAIDAERGEALLADWAERGVALATTDELLAALRRQPRHLATG